MLLTISISVLVSKWKGHDTGHEKVLLWRDQTRKCLSVTVPGKPLEQDTGFNSILSPATFISEVSCHTDLISSKESSIYYVPKESSIWYIPMESSI